MFDVTWFYVTAGLGLTGLQPERQSRSPGLQESTHAWIEATAGSAEAVVEAAEAAAAKAPAKKTVEKRILMFGCWSKSLHVRY